MIGQNIFKKWVEKFKNEGNYPKCVLILGTPGIGRRTMAKYLAKESEKDFVLCGNTVDEVREVIKTVNSCNYPTYFCFPDVDKLSPSAINALLKVLEEPPLKASFILTANASWKFETIRSRCSVFYAEPYSENELLNFTADSRNIKYEGVPERLLRLNKYGKQYSDDLIEFCNKVIDNIGIVTGVNSLKILKSLKIKDTDEGFDLDLFFDFLISELFNRMKNSSGYNKDVHLYFNMLIVTSNARSKLNIKGIKKDSLLDMWILDVRELYE